MARYNDMHVTNKAYIYIYIYNKTHTLQYTLKNEYWLSQCQQYSYLFKIIIFFNGSMKQGYKTILKAALVVYYCHNKTPQTGWPKQQKSIFPEFWRLEVQFQSVSTFGFSSLACGWGPSSHGLPSACVCVLIFSSYDDISQIGSGPTQMT